DFRASRDEKPADEVEGIFFVLDDQDAHTLERVGACGSGCVRPGVSRAVRHLDGRARRQHDREACALALAFALRVYRAAVQIHEMPRDRKTEPQAAETARDGRVALLEPLEDVR